MSCFNPTVFGVLALAASATASHSSFKRMSNHARVAASEWKRSAVSGVAYYGFQNNTMNACGTYSKDSDMIIGVGPDYYGDMGAVSDKCFQHVRPIFSSYSTPCVDADGCRSPLPSSLIGPRASM
jgi:hypothetical protein